MLSSIFCLAQTNDLLEAEGQIPSEFITDSSTKYKKQLSDLERDSKRKKSSKKEKKNKEQFFLESNFAIDDILQSGLVLFNDPATKYVNKVLKGLPTKKGRNRRVPPRAYVLDSPAVNAFATDQGIIFVTLGLIANLENEAQLAFILSHELIHYYHNHSINKFVNSKNISSSNKNFNFEKNKGNLSVNQKLFKESLYSRNIEEEADEEGLEIFQETNYDATSLPNVFRILHYSYLPFEDTAFEKSFFEDEHYTFPNKRWLKKVNEIKPMETKEDDNSSHPASIKRLNKIESKLSNSLDNENKKIYIVGEDEFKGIQQRARYQIPFLNLYNENFPEAIYTAYLNLSENKDDIELQKVVGKAIYMHAKYINHDDQNDISNTQHYKKVAKEIEGESHQVYNLLAQMNNKEALALAMRYNWKLLKENPKDIEIQATVDDLFIEMAIAYEDLDGFAKTPPPPKKGKSEDNEENEDEDKNKDDYEYVNDFDSEKKTKTKNEKIKDRNEKAKTKNEKIKATSAYLDYWQYAFIDFIQDKAFQKGFKEGKKTNSNREEIAEEYYSDSKKVRKEQRKVEKKGKALGVKKVVVINPYYLSVSEDKKNNTEVEYLRSEEKQTNFNEYITELGKKSKLKVDVLDIPSLRTSDIKKFNDIAMANRYFSQQMDQYDLSLTPGYEQAKMNELADKYNTDYFLWTGVISLKEKKKGSWLWVGLSAFLPYLLPFTIYNAVTPEYDMFYYAIMFDVTTGRRSILKTDFYDSRDSDAMVKSHIYDTYHQINSKRKK